MLGLQRCVHLTHLYLQRNNIKRIEGVATLTKLEKLCVLSPVNLTTHHIALADVCTCHFELLHISLCAILLIRWQIPWL